MRIFWTKIVVSRYNQWRSAASTDHTERWYWKCKISVCKDEEAIADDFPALYQNFHEGIENIEKKKLMSR
jgi:hypothetical protein